MLARGVSGVLVTGTDTGVGKTWVACALARALVARGMRVGVLKPAETGIPGGPRPSAIPAGTDAARLVDAAGCTAPVADVLPYAFALPAAPSVAAAEEGHAIDIDVVEAAYRRQASAHDIVLVEGAGGLLVPIVDAFTYADLAARLELPLLVVARTGLGTVNHTTLTERAARAADLEVLGVVLNPADGPVSAGDGRNLSVLAALLESPVLAQLEHGAAPEASVLAPVLEALLARGKRRG